MSFTTVKKQLKSTSFFRNSVYLLLAVASLTTVIRADVLYLPHVAAGGPSNGISYTTFVYIANPASVATSGRLDIFDNNGNPLPLLINGLGPTAAVLWSLVGGETARLELSSASSQIATGSIKLTRQSSTVQITAMFRQFIGGKLDCWIGVPVSVTPAKAFAIIFDTTQNRDSGLAISNPNNLTARVSIRLIGVGNSTLRIITRDVPPGGHVAEMLAPVFPESLGGSGILTRVQVDSDLAVFGMALMLDGTKFSYLPILGQEGESTLPPPG